MRRYTEKRVVKIPYYIQIGEPLAYDRAYFGLEEDVFYYLFMYDFKSVSARKNPEGMLKAFCDAFSAEEANRKKIGLIIKINHIEEKKLLELKKNLQNYQYIQYITQNLDRSEVESLESCADVYISLHRSEGFGLPAAEAMYLGKPVITTNWSATTEFMDAKSACLVDYKLVKLTKKIGPYEKGSEWAEPDVNQAKEYMRNLYENPGTAESVAQAAGEAIRRKLGRMHTTGLLRESFGYTDNTKKTW